VPVLDHRDVITGDDSVNITVTVERGQDPVRGMARLPGGEQRGFWGWMELITIVQEVLETGQGVPGRAQPDRDPAYGERAGGGAT
jgi:hypothetical protein